jgi:hypothetical protein
MCPSNYTADLCVGHSKEFLFVLEYKFLHLACKSSAVCVLKVIKVARVCVQEPGGVKCK